MRLAGLVAVMAAYSAQIAVIFYYTWAQENTGIEALAPNGTGSLYV